MRKLREEIIACDVCGLEIAPDNPARLLVIVTAHTLSVMRPSEMIVMDGAEYLDVCDCSCAIRKLSGWHATLPEVAARSTA